MKHTYKMTVLFSILPIIAFAKSDSMLIADESIVLKNMNEQAELHGLPKANSGIVIVPLAKMSGPENMQQEELSHIAQQKSKGYYDSDAPYVKELLSIKDQAKREIKELKWKNNPYDTHIKEHISDLKLAFSFTGLPMVNRNNIIGYVVMGGWHGGWTGVVEFFTDEKLGTCEFAYNNMALTHGADQIAAEAVRYDINSRPNILDVQGSEASGFLYDISWYNGVYDEELQCANMVYDSKITDRLISLAKEIDKTNLTKVNN
jgi:hypothetical protein